ncbi:MAG: hypothetical protein OXF32_00855 [Anaerolineaceae bacterium]|nr:hypothetical protein [Anaerolineaceae bacterium]
MTPLPLTDLRILFGLRWRQFRSGAVFWLRLLGYDAQASSWMQRVYVLYLLGIGSIWFFAMWAWGHDLALSIGESMAPQTLAQLLERIPPAVLLLQVWAMMASLRSTPLKLSFPDMAWIVGSPLARSVPVLPGFIRQVLTRCIIFGAIWALLTVLLRAPLTPATPLDSLRVVLVVGLLVVLTWSLAWLLGILRLVYPQVSRWRWLWLTPLLLLPLAQVAPDQTLWPGRLLVLSVYDLTPLTALALIALVAAGLVASFVILGARINMIQAADESAVYARLAALGLLAWRMPDLQLRIRLQQARAGQRPRLRIPSVYGKRAMVVRSAIAGLRHPSLMLVNALWGAGMTWAAGLILVNELPVPLWIGWLLIAGIAPPIGLLYTFRRDVQEPFLRQFLPLDGFQIFMADVLLPLAFLLVGALLAWFRFLQEVPPELFFEFLITGVMTIPLLGLLLALCGAAAMTATRELQTRLLGTGASFGLAIVASVLLGTPLAGLVVVCIAIALLGGILMQHA